MEPLVSIIVPIYKIERYIGICIESLMKQTYKNIEIILVDDGSPDRSPEICDLYSSKDDRIKVIHKENGGLVSARKAGLAAAVGDYVGYVDGDDWVEPTFYEALVKAAIRSGADLVVAGQSKDLFSTSSKITSRIPEGVYRGVSLEKLKKNMLSYGEFFSVGVNTYVWNKLFRRELLIGHQNAVPDGVSIGEDAAVVYPYIMECGTVRIIDDCGYHYRQREDSMLKKSAAFRNEAVGLRLLRGHLESFAAKYPDTYGLKKQVTDYLLGICIMRSGGMIKELSDEYAPYGRDFYGKKVVVWSAGTFGQQLVYRIKENGCCVIVGWVDVDYWEYRRCCLDVDPVDSADEKDFDYILIATVDGASAARVRTDLAWRGIDEKRILTVRCPEDGRDALLDRYLSI